MLNFYRPPYDDELLYGWITALADMNFPMDTAGIRRVIDCLFPFSKPPQKRGVIVKDPVRKDYIRGLDMNVRRMQEQGYKVPSADVLLRCSTPVAAMGICWSKGNAARYIHTVMAPVTGTWTDMPVTPDLVKELRYCPDCMRQERCLRTWHHLSGVKACAVHGKSLIRINRKELQELLGGRIKLPDPEVACEDDVSYAEYVKKIYEDPAYSFEDVCMSLSDRGIQDPLLYKYNIPFEKAVRFLMRYGPCGGSAAACRMAEFHCDECGTVWTDSADAPDHGFGCPVCMPHEDAGDWTRNILSGTGDGRYRMKDPFTGMGGTQTILHETCGKETDVRWASVIWEGRRCACEAAHTTAEMQEMFGAEGFIVTDYEPITTRIRYKHSCGSSCIITVQEAKEHGGLVCRACREKDVTAHRKEALQIVLGPGFEVTKCGARGKIVVRHRPCGKVITRNYRDMLRIGPACPFCSPYRIGRRTADSLSVKARIYRDITEQSDAGHKVWIRKRRSVGIKTKDVDIALEALLRTGKIRKLSYGCYAKTNDDVTVYDVLRELYLSEGGQFTGQTAEYLAGKADEPEIITLESARLVRKSPNTVNVLGRRVAVCGIKRPKEKPYNNEEFV